MASFDTLHMPSGESPLRRDIEPGKEPFLECHVLISGLRRLVPHEVLGVPPHPSGQN